MCLDEEQILLLIGGTLSDADRGEAEAHLEGCEACRRLVAVAMRTAPTGGEGPYRSVLARGASVGRYLVLSLVGRGGMGEVFAAYDPELDRRVALKLLRTARGAERARQRLGREARALGKLSHPNVVQVYDVGEHQGDVFVAMELVDGQSFEAWCLAAPRPSWQEVLAAYLDAARGLSAAHASGLVHRDVKPSNILRGKDGRVRVADFGLAAGHVEETDGEEPRGAEGARPAALGPGNDTLPLGDTAPAPLGGGRTMDRPLTATGVLLGTPLYMAPEQHEGSQVTPASDQYSLCMALYHGLWGEQPFSIRPGTHSAALRDLHAQKRAGVPASPPAGSSVPAWVYSAIARGLAPDPRSRYPSIDALIAALREDPGARRRAGWRRAAIAGATAALLAAGAAGWIRYSAFNDPCQHPERQLAGVWDKGVEGRLRAAFLGSGRPYAESTAARVTAAIESYALAWSAMRGEVCRASRADAQHRETYALRDYCLDRRRGQLQAFTSLFADKPDVQILDRAVAITDDLSPIAFCADTEALRARVLPPESPALRAEVAALQPRADELEALFLAGKYKAGLPLGEKLLAETRAVPYPPVVARVQFWTGLLRDGTGDYEGAKTLLREAAVSAAEGRDESLVASTWVRLLAVVADHQQRFDEAAAIRAQGPLMMAVGHNPRTRGAWLNAEAGTLWRMGKYAEARDTYEQAISVLQAASASDLVVGATLNNLGNLLTDMDDFPNALAMQERGLALRERAVGPSHPAIAQSMTNIANALMGLGDFARARDTYLKALAIREGALGPDHPDVAMSLNNLGSCLFNLGEYPEALNRDERARAAFEKALGPDHPSVALVLFNLGYILGALGDLPRALAMHERALAIREKRLGPDHPDVADALVALGRTLVRLRRLDAAEPLLERGRRVKAKAKGTATSSAAEPLLALAELELARHAPEPAVPLLDQALSLHPADIAGEIQLTLAEALWQVGKDRPRARSLAAEARSGYEHLGHRPGTERALRWLADHPL